MRQLANLRQQILHPKGIQITPTRNFAKPQPIDKFVDYNIVIHRGDKPLEKNTLAFKFEPYKYSITKPELKQYLEKIYGLSVSKVHTVNYMGKIKRNHKGGRYRERDFKKAYVELNEDIDSFFQKVERS